jgi:hypothetical protein
MPLYLGNTELLFTNTLFGDKVVKLEQNFTEAVLPVTDSIQLYFDAALWNGTDATIFSPYGNATASLSSVTKVSNAFNFTTSSAMSVSSSGFQAIGFDITSSLVLVYRPSGSATDHHGRILNGNNNWLFGTYGGGPGTPAAETNYSWYNGTFIIDSGSYSTDWKMMTGIMHGTAQTSQSVYINSTYKTGASGTARSGFNGLSINRGSFIPNEATQCDVAAFILYKKELTPTEIGQIYNYYNAKYIIP